MAKNDKEAEALLRFRDAVANIDEIGKSEDHFLLRWLRARNLDIEKAKNMLQKYLEWRANSGDLKVIASGSWFPPRLITDRIKVKITGFDHEGRPIVWSDAGRWELGQIHDAGLRDDLFRYIYSIMDNYIMTQVEQQRKQKDVSQFIFVLNTSGVTLRKALHFQSAQTRIRFVREFEAYFPECLHSCYILNAPWVITNIYAILKPFISTNTQEKVNLFGSHAEEWKAVLRNKFPEGSIPEDYGGTGPSYSALYETNEKKLF